MPDSMFKSAFILLVWIITAPSGFSIATSVIASVYFAAMLKINVVDKKYDGSWRKFIKSIFKG